jgi:hypothetical protein
MGDQSKITDQVDIGTDTEEPMQGRTFSVDVDGRVEVEDGSLPALGDRPAKSADRGAWLDYCVSLGADRHFLDNETEHVHDATPGGEVVETSAPFSKDELIDLANSLGG